MQQRKPNTTCSMSEFKGVQRRGTMRSYSRGEAATTTITYYPFSPGSFGGAAGSAPSSEPSVGVSAACRHLVNNRVAMLGCGTFSATPTYQLVVEVLAKAALAALPKWFLRYSFNGASGFVAS